MVLYGGSRSRTHDGAGLIWVRAITSLAGCGAVLAGCLAVSPPAALAGPAASGQIASGGMVPVVACPAPDATYYKGTGAKVPPVMQYPGGLPRPSGTQVFGFGMVPLYGDRAGRVYYVLGPAGFRCEHTQIAMDGSTEVVLDDPDRPDYGIEMVIAVDPGNGWGSIQESCPYIPAVRNAVRISAAASPASDMVAPAQICAAAPGLTVAQIPTNQPGLYVAAVRVPKTLTPSDPAASTAPLLSDGTDSPVAVYITSLASQRTQEIGCALPPALMSVCAADLELFLTTQSSLSAQFRLPNLVAAKQALASFLAGQQGEPPATDEVPACGPAAIDFSLEKEIASLHLADPMPADTMNMPDLLEGEVKASASLGGASICERGVSAHVSGPADPTDLTLNATAAGAAEGPFTYSLDSTAWTSVPGAPPDQDFTTRFRLSVKAEVNPQLSVDLLSGKPSLDLATVTLTAIEVPPVTLVNSNPSLLQVSMDPQITLTAEIEDQAVEDTELEAEDEGVDSQTAISDAAEEISGNAAIAVQEEAAEYYGVSASSLSGQEQLLYADLDSRLQEALNALEATPAADEIADPASETADEMTPAETDAAADAEGAGIEADPVVEFLALLL